MGYYSFYKIIKDIFRTIFGSKFIKFIFVFLIIFFILSIYNNVKADNEVLYTINNSTETLDLTDLQQYYYYVGACYYTRERSYTYQVVVSDKPFIIYTNSNPTNTNGGTFYTLDQCALYTAFGSGTLTQLRNIITNAIPSGSFNPNYGFSVYNPSRANGNLTVSADSAVIATNFDIKDQNGDVIFNSTVVPSFVYPFFTPSTSDIQSLNFDNLFVELGDYNLSENKLYLHALEIINSIPENNDVLYYYSDNVFNLDTKSIYYKQFFDTTNYYFSIPKGSINFGVDKSYLLVLTNKKSLEMNSVGLYEKNETEGFFDVVLVDTSGIVSESEVINNNINNINNNINPNSPINNQLESSTDESIDTNLNFNNQNSSLNNLNNGFFTRLTTLLNNMIDYDSNVDTVVSIPYPNSNKTLDLHSNMISSNLSNVLQLLISAFWFYVFGFYMFRFINKIYIAVTSGSILDTFSNSDEAITNNML